MRCSNHQKWSFSRRHATNRTCVFRQNIFFSCLLQLFIPFNNSAIFSTGNYFSAGHTINCKDWSIMREFRLSDTEIPQIIPRPKKIVKVWKKRQKKCQIFLENYSFFVVEANENWGIGIIWGFFEGMEIEELRNENYSRGFLRGWELFEGIFWVDGNWELRNGKLKNENYSRSFLRGWELFEGIR